MKNEWKWMSAAWIEVRKLGTYLGILISHHPKVRSLRKQTNIFPRKMPVCSNTSMGFVDRRMTLRQEK